MSIAITAIYRADRDWYNRRGIYEAQVDKFIDFIDELGEKNIDTIVRWFDEYALGGFEL